MLFLIQFYLAIGCIGALTNLYAVAYQKMGYSWRLQVRQTLLLILAWPMFTYSAWAYRHYSEWK